MSMKCKFQKQETSVGGKVLKVTCSLFGHECEYADKEQECETAKSLDALEE